MSEGTGGVKQERYENISDIQFRLQQLRDGVCELCATNDPTYCEVVDGITTHVGGVCKANTVRELMTHVDDVRDQFANEFNEEEKPRALWSYRMNP